MKKKGKQENHIEFAKVADMLEGLIIDSKAFDGKVTVYKGAVYTLEKLIIEASSDQLDILADEAFFQEFGVLPTSENLGQIYKTLEAKRNSAIL